MKPASEALFPGVALHVVRRVLAAENAKFGPTLQKIPRDRWPPGQSASMVEVWRSRRFLVQVLEEPAHGVLRISVNRTTIGDDRRWVDGITWDELMEIKAQIGRADRYAVELYPAAVDVVNVANIRHLWILEEAPPYAWRKGVRP